MKVEIYNNKKHFPLLAIDKVDGMIVLFITEKEGTILKRGTMKLSDDMIVGYHSEYFRSPFALNSIIPKEYLLTIFSNGNGTYPKILKFPNYEDIILADSPTSGTVLASDLFKFPIGEYITNYEIDQWEELPSINLKFTNE